MFLCGTLLVAMKRVKARMRVLLATGSQWASCMVKRMAPYRLALVGLQEAENKRHMEGLSSTFNDISCL